MKNRVWSVVLAVAVALSAFSGLCFTASADALTEGYYTFTVSGGKATVTEVDKSISGDVVVPSALAGYPVTSLGDRAFYGCTEIKSVDVPKTVKHLGTGVFLDCSALETASLLADVTAIPEETFNGCVKLSVLALSASIRRFPANSFEGCDSLTLVYYFATKEQFDTEGYLIIEDSNSILYNVGWICLGFPDVDYGKWYGESVAFAVSSGIMTGYGSGNFGTADGIQRQDFVVILHRISGDTKNYTGGASFKDDTKGNYYSNALAWAKANGVSSGYTNGKFGVGDRVTREQIMTFLHNIATRAGCDMTVTDAEKNEIRQNYSDFGSISGYAKEAVYWALSRGVISGKDAGGGKKLIAPKSNALRCEVAAMFYNLFENGVLVAV